MRFPCDHLSESTDFCGKVDRTNLKARSFGRDRNVLHRLDAEILVCRNRT